MIRPTPQFMCMLPHTVPSLGVYCSRYWLQTHNLPAPHLRQKRLIPPQGQKKSRVCVNEKVMSYIAKMLHPAVRSRANRFKNQKINERRIGRFVGLRGYVYRSDQGACPRTFRTAPHYPPLCIVPTLDEDALLLSGARLTPKLAFLPYGPLSARRPSWSWTHTASRSRCTSSNVACAGRVGSGFGSLALALGSRSAPGPSAVQHSTCISQAHLAHVAPRCSRLCSSAPPAGEEVRLLFCMALLAIVF